MALEPLPFNKSSECVAGSLISMFMRDAHVWYY